MCGRKIAIIFFAVLLRMMALLEEKQGKKNGKTPRHVVL